MRPAAEEAAGVSAFSFPSMFRVGKHSIPRPVTGTLEDLDSVQSILLHRSVSVSLWDRSGLSYLLGDIGPSGGAFDVALFSGSYKQVG